MNQVVLTEYNVDQMILEMVKRKGQKSGGPERKVQKGSEHRASKRNLSSNDTNSVFRNIRKKSRREETVAPTTSGYNLRPRIGKREESRPTIERKTQQGGPVRSRKGRERNDSPYIEERTRSSNKNARRGGDQQRQNQERRATCTKKSLSLEVLEEVEKVAYQLNEEAERTERQIRRLSKVMYGSTCADMQVDVMGECLSSVKHVVGREVANNQSVRRHLDAFTRGRHIGKLEKGCSVISVAAEFGIAHSIVSRLWRQFQTTGTAIRGFSSGCPRGTTPADDRYIVLQARRNRRQTAGEIARHTTQATGRPISRFTVARRLHGGGLFARRPVRCVPLTPAHRRRRSLWCREHRNWRDNGRGRVCFTDESRFSLSSDSHRILIWRERGSHNHPSDIIERDRGAMGLQFLFMDDNAPCHRTVAAEQLLESRRLAARTLPPVTIRELRLALQDEWAAMPQQLIDTLLLSMGRRCEICLAVRGDHIPY
ncbi:transposable element Tcb2 transposase [Trichonephila clavipes]|nr:transposable element Tcb2 transposase [Trichonephila clavipes]